MEYRQFMAKRRLNRRQSWRIDKIQQERIDRANKKSEQAEKWLSDGELEAEKEGLVTAHFGMQVEVVDVNDELRQHRFRCHFRANLGSLVTGDRVVWRFHPKHGLGVIVAVMPRRSELNRPDSHGREKTIAANIDQIVVVFAPYPEPFANLLDRYLVAAYALNIPVCLVLNKSDRIDGNNRAKITQLTETYKHLGYQVLTVSKATGDGIEELIAQLQGHISIFVGQSGVGKSSLVNKLLPEVNARVGELSEARQKGTHTTTTAQLFHFPGGGDLIDSPGIREFGLWHMEPEQVLEGFIEVRPFIGHCKFRDCKHEHEPGCAILKAVENGEISSQRMDSYRQIIGPQNL